MLMEFHWPMNESFTNIVSVEELVSCIKIFWGAGEALCGCG